ncbi:MAG: DUF3750 domain-containing protein [Myxococcota bacterium]
MRRGALLGLALAALVGCHPRVRHPDVSVAVPTGPVVQLRRADVVFPVGEHYYFVAFDPAGDGRWHRNELFARVRDQHRVTIDFLPPDSSFDARAFRPAHIVREYHGRRAERLLHVLSDSREVYADQDRYVLTGPNSNSYAAWVLRRARVGYDFPSRAIGRRFPTRVGLSDSRTGVAVHTPVLGFELGLLDGFELDLGPATMGLDLVPPALVTPIGRLGFPDPSLPVGPRPRERRTAYRAAEAEVLERFGTASRREALRTWFDGDRTKAKRWLRYHTRRKLTGPPPGDEDREHHHDDRPERDGPHDGSHPHGPHPHGPHPSGPRDPTD